MQKRPNRKVAVIGCGQTEYKRHDDKNFPQLIFEAVNKALDDANLKIKDIDAVVFGSGPEYFEGINFPEKWCVDAAGAYLKPYIRIHTGGTVGIATAAAAYYHVASGLYNIVLAVAGDKLTDGSVQASLSTVSYPLYSRKFSGGAVGGAGLGLRETMHKFGITLEDAARVAVKQRKNALLNPYAHLKIPNISIDMVMESKVISEPLRLLDTCPTSDGAAAMIFASSDIAKNYHNPAWVKSCVSRSESGHYADRDNVNTPRALIECIKEAYRQAGIKDPKNEIDVFEFYDPFSYLELTFLNYFGICEKEEVAEFVKSGRTEISGDVPVCPSGGVLSANTIGCAAMARAVEAVLQVRGKAGKHQVKNVKNALAHGWGGTFQFHVVMIFGKEE